MTIDEAVKSLNEEARQEMKKCSCLDEMMKVFSDDNIDITVDEIENAFNNRELSDDELAGVTGGVAGDVVVHILKFVFGKLFDSFKDDKKIR